MNLQKIKILVVGVGGLGSPASLALAQEGVGTLGLVDPDRVEASNLHRQILYSENNIGQLKVEAAQERLRHLFPAIQVHIYPESFGSANAAQLFENYDVIVDGLDRLEKKYVLNDWCVRLKKPFVHAGVVKFEGQVLPVLPGQTACLRCLLPKIPPPFAMPTCREAGVLGSFSQAVGYLQAYETLQLVQGAKAHFLWKLDIQKREARAIRAARNPHCEACGKGLIAQEVMSSC